MVVHNLGEKNSIAGQFMRELRDVQLQKYRLRFRNNLCRLGELMAYEISKTLDFQPTQVETPLGKKLIHIPDPEIVLLTVLRAGLPFQEGFTRIFDRADIGFIGSYRVEGGAEIHIKRDYMATPSLVNKTVILTDTMLATGRSLADAVNTLTRHGHPKHLHMACVISTPDGIKYLQENINTPATLWVFSVDEGLNEKFYIVPGLGDAGDLSFGSK
jgi:uracil phosphoribosyltransferase